ncbi:protein-glutamate methylesterase/protein-glutamine glutaminase [Pseudothermotoga thermarum]|uniref:Protein-glutamate methylesterase/protein-glutamine glutaminase n=2 Tax=Pseudothermotoga thermarum TaxID=119394 RepID=F7YYI3_9THEM|nr:chemotaxis response regulator protein-glutamate methylesterase [Pseudothermotoga thermarum]AEH51012.1 response regulator receiver modulated CheB methylesterase [Pseudothermotoga thermarum DSM 5069]
MSNAKARIVIVDDSAFMRMVLKDIIDSQPDMQVVGFAKDGLEALEVIAEKKPDLVTLDVEMPRMNGIETLKQIMAKFPTRVIMVSSLTEEGADITLTALSLGAVDFVTKPAGSTSLSFRTVADELIQKIRAALQIPISKLTSKPTVAKVSLKIKQPILGQKAVVIGSSTGGPKSLDQIIPALPKDFPAPIFVVQHMPPVFTKSLAMRLNSISELNVKEAEDGEIVKAGFVYVAPGDWHMGVKVVNRDVKIFLDKSDKINNVRPAVDFTLNYVAEIYKSNTIAVILTGMGRDGQKGAFKVKYYSGKVIAEDETTCAVFGMPKAVIEEGYADFVLPAYKIAEKLVELVQER